MHSDSIATNAASSNLISMASSKPKDFAKKKRIHTLDNNLFNNMDPRYTGEILRHLDKQNELLTDTYRSMSNELQKLQVEEEMLMRKFYEFMTVQALANKVNDDNDMQAGGDTNNDRVR